MGIFSSVKYTFRNLSGRAIRNLITAAIILCVSIALSVPALVEDLKQQRMQAADDDGIENSTAAGQGMDEDILSQGARYMDNYDTLSLLVVRHGKIVLEKYYTGGKYSTSNVFSITKSFVSALTGIAVNKGLVGSIDDPLDKYLPSYFNNSTAPGWRDIRIKHLLTMTPGFLEGGDWTTGGDWVGSTFRLPLNYRPGEKFQYANSATHLLAVALTKACDANLSAFAQENLFSRLKFRNASWTVGPDGYIMGFSNLSLRPRDLAKFGCLYLNGGKWDGVQLVPEEWVEESTRVQYDFNKEDDKGYENGYGYLWWISGETGRHMFSAKGYGGQSIDVIPELDLVVVITSTPDSPLSVTDAIRMELLKKYVIPAIKDK